MSELILEIPDHIKKDESQKWHSFYVPLNRKTKYPEQWIGYINAKLKEIRL